MIAAGFLCFLSQADVRQSKQVGEANRTRGCQSAGVSDDVSGHFVVHGAGPSPPSPSIAPSLPLSLSVSLSLSLSGDAVRSWPKMWSLRPVLFHVIQDGSC